MTLEEELGVTLEEDSSAGFSSPGELFAEVLSSQATRPKASAKATLVKKFFFISISLQKFQVPFENSLYFYADLSERILNAMMANAPATFMLALRPAIGMVTFMVVAAMISGAIPSSSFPKIIRPFSGHVTLFISGMSSPVSRAIIS